MLFPWNLLPFKQGVHKEFLEMKPEEIEKYVQQMVGKMFSPGMKGMVKPEDWLKGMEDNAAPPNEPRRGLEPAIFETHDFVFVRLPLREEHWIKQMKLFYTSNQVIIEQIPNLEDKHTFILPAIVKRKGAAAIHRDGVLELKLPKMHDMQYSEIDLS